MRFKPKTTEELDSMNLMKPGIYSFRVANATEQISKSGNEMIKLTIEVYDDFGTTFTIFDYLLEAMAHKLNHFCESVGLYSKYQAGEMTSVDCIGKCGYVEIANQKGGENPTGGTYPDKNAVKDYVLKKPVKSGELPLGREVPFDDQIPF